MRKLLTAALIAMLLVSLAPAAMEFASTPAQSAAGDSSFQPGDSTPVITASSRPDHTARVVRTVRAPRRLVQARLASEPVMNTSASGESRLERRRAALPSPYFLLLYRTAPRAPARG